MRGDRLACRLARARTDALQHKPDLWVLCLKLRSTLSTSSEAETDSLTFYEGWACSSIFSPRWSQGEVFEMASVFFSKEDHRRATCSRVVSTSSESDHFLSKRAFPGNRLAISHPGYRRPRGIQELRRIPSNLRSFPPHQDLSCDFIVYQA